MKRRYLALIASSIMSLSLITGCGKSTSQSSAPEESVAVVPSIEAVTPTATPEPTEEPETTEAPEATDVAEVTETPTEEPTETPENKEESEPTATPTATPTEVQATATPTPTVQTQPTAAEVQPTAAQMQAVAEQPQPTVVAEQSQTTPAPTQAAAQSQTSDHPYNTTDQSLPLHSTVYIEGQAYEYGGLRSDGVVVDSPAYYNNPLAACLSDDEIYERVWEEVKDPATGEVVELIRHSDWDEDYDTRIVRFENKLRFDVPDGKLNPNSGNHGEW
ncbi:MAG: hypothetical protein K6B69_16040 [Lachnospiraceae bacterium]|nr:hypothetical protein [Lachnospiraceae bacterium]